MAAKKRRGSGRRSGSASRPRAPRPADPGAFHGEADAEARPDRRARKEQARRERERRTRRARRRQTIRRVVRWGIVVAVAAAIVGFVYVQGTEERRLREQAAAAAERLGCSDVQDVPDEGASHLTPGQPPPDYGTVPAASGPHAGAPLPPDPHVYEQPVPEPQAIHNLEHGYVLSYYREEGEEVLPGDVVERLADLAEDETKVIMAPYPSLEPGTSLALVGWTKLQECPEVTDPGDMATVAQAFLGEGATEAPEPGAP